MQKYGAENENAGSWYKKTLACIFKPWSVLYKNIELLKVMTLRLWFSRGKDGSLHLLWPLLTPVFLLLIYYFAFGVILNIRNVSGGGNYAFEMFCGAAVFNIFAETVYGASGAIKAQQNIVKKSVMDLELIPLSITGCAVLSGIIYLAVILIAALFSGGIGGEIIKLPLLAVCFILFCAGCACFVSALSAYIADVSMALPLIVQALFFGTPIIYPLKVVPESLCRIIKLNPLTGFVCAIRDSILNTRTETGYNILILFLTGLLMYIFGLLFFARVKKGFADVL